MLFPMMFIFVWWAASPDTAEYIDPNISNPFSVRLQTYLSFKVCFSFLLRSSYINTAPSIFVNTLFFISFLSNAVMTTLLGVLIISYTHLRAHETRHDLVCR